MAQRIPTSRRGGGAWGIAPFCICEELELHVPRIRYPESWSSRGPGLETLGVRVTPFQRECDPLGVCAKDPCEDDGCRDCITAYGRLLPGHLDPDGLLALHTCPVEAFPPRSGDCSSHHMHLFQDRNSADQAPLHLGLGQASHDHLSKSHLLGDLQSRQFCLRREHSTELDQNTGNATVSVCR